MGRLSEQAAWRSGINHEVQGKARNVMLKVSERRMALVVGEMTQNKVVVVVDVTLR